jgi:hypothetical protein
MLAETVTVNCTSCPVWSTVPTLHCPADMAQLILRLAPELTPRVNLASAAVPFVVDTFAVNLTADPA